MPEQEQITPTRPSASSPAEISRQHDLAALNALGALGLTPASSARFGRALEDSERPDLALLMQMQVEDGEGA